MPAAGVYLNSRGLQGCEHRFVSRAELGSAVGSEAHLLIAVHRPADPVGVHDLDLVALIPDGKSYAYSYQRSLADLWLVEGLK